MKYLKYYLIRSNNSGILELIMVLIPFSIFLATAQLKDAFTPLPPKSYSPS